MVMRKRKANEWRVGDEPVTFNFVPGVGVELPARLKSRKLFITRTDKTGKTVRHAEARYMSGTRTYARECA